MRTFSSYTHQAGLTLLEVLLALGISLSVASLALNDIKFNNESAQANATGDQLRQAGEALNTYIALNYNSLILRNDVIGDGTAEDVGPRSCHNPDGSAAGGTFDPAVPVFCIISEQTLRNSGLLPSNFTNVNPFGAQYRYVIRVVGAAPSVQVEGMVFTSDPYTNGATNPRYDLLGLAMLRAGADSSMTRTTANTLEGLNGTWSTTSYPAVVASTAATTAAGLGSTPLPLGPNNLGLLAYRSGYGASGYAAYLRRDGTTPMTGDLNLGQNRVYNVAELVLYKDGVLDTDAPRILASGAVGDDSIIAASDDGLVVRNRAGTADAAFRAGDGSFSTNLAVLGTTSLTGDVELLNDLEVAGEILSAGNITTQANLLSQGGLTVAGASNLNTLSVANGADFSGTANFNNTGTSINISGDIVGATSNSDISVGGTISATSASSVITTNGTLQAPRLVLTGLTPHIAFSNGVTIFNNSANTLTVNGSIQTATGRNILSGNAFGTPATKPLNTPCDALEVGQFASGGNGGLVVCRQSEELGGLRWLASSNHQQIVRAVSGTTSRAPSCDPSSAWSSSQVASCGAGQVLLGGGYTLVNFESCVARNIPYDTNNDGTVDFNIATYLQSNAPDYSTPNDADGDGSMDSWVIGVGPAVGHSTFQAYALCGTG